MYKQKRIYKIKKGEGGFSFESPSSIMTDGLFKNFTSSINKNTLSSPINDIGKISNEIKSSDVTKTAKASKGLFSNAGISKLNSKFGGISSLASSAINTINDSVVKSESTGNVADAANKASGVISGISSKINPMGGLANSAGKLIGNLIGGTKNRVQGTGSAVVGAVSSGLSHLGPIGMAAGAVLNIINGIGFGGRAMKVADQSSEFGSGFSGSKSYVHNAVDKYSGKKAGTFDFGWKKKANAKLREAKRQQGEILNIQEDDRMADLNVAGDFLASNYNNTIHGFKPQLILSRKGTKIPELEEIRKMMQTWKKPEDSILKCQLGGKMNLIPEGNLHAHKHHLEDVNSELKDQITKKGIPVVAQSEGGIVQTAEIEKDEWTLRKEFTDKLEALYKAYQEDSSNEIAIEAGKLVCHELLKNTDDRSGLIKSVK